MKVESSSNSNITSNNSLRREHPRQTNQSNSGISYLPDKKSIEIAVKGLNDSIKITHTNLQFKFHEDLNEYYVSVVNEDSGEVIREIPAKDFLDKVAQLFKLVGLIVDEKR